jgi:hypothetical protein
MFGLSAISRADMHTENMFVYIDTEYDNAIPKYYAYSIGNITFYIKVTPYIIKVADYGADNVFPQNMQTIALKTNIKNLTDLYSKDNYIKKKLTTVIPDFISKLSELDATVRNESDLNNVLKHISTFFKDIINFTTTTLGNTNIQLNKPTDQIIELNLKPLTGGNVSNKIKKMEKYVNKLSNTPITSSNFQLYLDKLNYWHEQ